MSAFDRAIIRVKLLQQLGPTISLSWTAHRKAHPERYNVTGSWRRMKNQARQTYLRLKWETTVR